MHLNDAQSGDKPWVGVAADIKTMGPHEFHAVGDKYLNALITAADVVPVLLPAYAHKIAVQAWLSRLDGVFLPGAYSNVHPSHYGETDELPDTLHDEHRDNLTLNMIRLALEQGKPLFGVCRGYQEMNVALGGSLHQNLHRTQRHQEHREDKSRSLAEQYGPSHDVHLTPDGVLARATGTQTLRVNSLHTQGVNQLASGLIIEAKADDGLIEAFSVKGAKAFAVGVQWHPEWQVADHPHNQQLFAAFGAACRSRMKSDDH
ncbi:MAG: gamma-glutamyl-gamma-aminobutyrate hydrolase family protein [Natronospirillum sp.]